MAPENDLPADYRRVLNAFGYRWNKETRVWANREKGHAISQETVRPWTLDELAEWLTRDAAKP